MKAIYLDYASTTPVDPRVVDKMQACLMQTGHFGNAASLHSYGGQAALAVETARAQIAATIHAQTSELIFTSGATESINLALKGVAHLYQSRGRHIITMKTEHKAVLDACQHLEKQGFQVTYLNPQKSGLLDLAELEAAFKSTTILVSIMHVNNETGVIQDIDAISKLTAARGILFHVDAAQSIGKEYISVKNSTIDLLSLSAHKVYGPKGIGALYLRKKPRVRVAPFIHGGGHEQGMRSGTLPTHQIVGMGMAYELAAQENVEEQQRIKSLRDLFLQELLTISVCKLNTVLDHIVPHILSVRFEGLLATALLKDLPLLAASTASACVAKTSGSYVLRAMGLDQQAVQGAVRFSLGRYTTKDEIYQAVNMIKHLFRII